MAERTPAKPMPPAKHAVGREREKRQPYATETEAYEGEAVKSPKDSDLPDAGGAADTRARSFGEPHPDPQKLRTRR